jgi:hypothetical protein
MWQRLDAVVLDEPKLEQSPGRVPRRPALWPRVDVIAVEALIFGLFGLVCWLLWH